MLSLWCAGKLCKGADGEAAKRRFRFTCLCCRWRRKYLGKFVDPPYWIHYTYLSQYQTRIVDSYKHNGYVYRLKSGKKLQVTTYSTLKIDPRGHFTALRCAVIIALDKIMKQFHIGKPLVEICEFLANYP